MTEVSIDRFLARELVETNLVIIKSEIDSILKVWEQKSAQKMIERTRRGELPEAEMDAIALTNLLDKRNELERLMSKIGG